MRISLFHLACCEGSFSGLAQFAPRAAGCKLLFSIEQNKQDDQTFFAKNNRIINVAGIVLNLSFLS
jgi:hypothetical protein